MTSVYSYGLFYLEYAASFPILLNPFIVYSNKKPDRLFFGEKVYFLINCFHPLIEGMTFF